MRARAWRWFFLLLFATAASAESDKDRVPRHIGERLEVSLVTVEPGPFYWQRYGHNAILLEDPVTDFSGLYNYGVFDFEQPNFVLNFLRGRMLYRLLTLPADRDMQRYLDDGRPIQVQRLNFDSEQTLRLARYLERNRLPENAEYEYDYFFDNCSTRVRDALDQALEGQLSSALQQRPADATLREHAERYSSADWWVFLGVKLALGRPVDEAVSKWTESFIPMVLRDAVDELQIDTAGGRVPLVAVSDEIRADAMVTAPSARPVVWPWWLAAGVVLGVVWLAISGVPSRWVDWALGIWCLEMGVIGVLLSLLWLSTEHAGTHRNENILLFTPILIPVGLGVLRQWRGTVMIGLIGCALVCLLTAVLMKLLPGAQSNIAALAFGLTANGAALVAVWRRTSRRR